VTAGIVTVVAAVVAVAAEVVVAAVVAVAAKVVVEVVAAEEVVEVEVAVAAVVAEEKKKEEKSKVRFQETVLRDKPDNLTILDKCDNKSKVKSKVKCRRKGEGTDKEPQIGLSTTFLEDLQCEIVSLEAPHATVDNVLDILGDHPMLCAA